MNNSFNSKNTKTLDASSDGRAKDSSPVILIVDDDDDNRLMLKTLLEMWQYRVVEVKNGGEAIGIAEKALPDLILMDVKMPELDGFEITQKIRQSAKIESIPIIFLSGCAEAEYKQQAFVVGGNEYLVKPLDFRDLENTLGKYVSRGQPQKNAV